MYLCENIVNERRLFEIAISNILFYYLGTPYRIEWFLKYPLIIVPSDDFKNNSRISGEILNKTKNLNGKTKDFRRRTSKISR